MVKKKIEKPNRKTKDELLDIVNEHLQTQLQFAETLKQKALQYIDVEEDTKESKSKTNRWLNAYNQQVDALSRTSSLLIKITSSSLENGEEDEKEEDSLVD